MTEQIPPIPASPQPPAPDNRRQGGLVGGLILILIGLLALLDKIPGLDLGNIFLPGLGLIFLAAGYLNRKIGLVIPGGILLGIGLGSILESLPLRSEMSGGLFLIAFGAGWGLITLVSMFIGRRVNWPLIPGGILAGIGLFQIVSNFAGIDFGLFFLPVLGAIFLAAGLLTRKVGLLIPGGILAGIGAGALLLEKYIVDASDTTQGGVFLLAFAGGWLLITLSALLLKSWTWWPLIPGGILALVGAALLAGPRGIELLQYANYLWPVALIGVGLYLLFRRRNLDQ